jgi:hypothetical protein
VKLSSAVKDIITNRYPADQKAGLMSAIYTMEPTYPYKNLHGELCDDIHSIAISVLSDQEEYKIALANPNDNLFLYLETHTKADIDRLRSYYAKDNQCEGRIAALRMAYEIDPDIPFLSQYPSSSLPNIIHSFGYEDCSEDEWMSLSDGRLLSWLYSHGDNMACEALRIMTQGKKPSRALGYKVLYNIDRNAAYDLRDANTPVKVGEVYREQLKEWQSLEERDFAARISETFGTEGRFVYYAQLHGWMEQISQMRVCFDLKSDENKERLGAYDLRTAAYRFCRILGVAPSYLLEDGAELTDGANFDKVAHRPALLSAMKHGALSQWMSVFFHEDPNEDFAETYSYERKLEEWIVNLGEVDPNQMYFKRFENAKRETAQKYNEVKQGYQRAKGKEKRWRITFYALCAIWLVLLFVCGISGRSYVLDHALVTIALPVGGTTAVIVGLRAFFRGYGFVFSCLWGLLGFLSSWIPILLLKYINGAWPELFVPAVGVITLIYMLVSHFTNYRGDTKNDSQLINNVMGDDIKTTLLEPLYYTFKQKSFRFKGSKFGMLDDVTDQVKSISGESVLHYILWSVMVGLVVMEMALFHPMLLNYPNPKLENIHLSPSNVVKQLQKDVE